jgi:hypothetical protein
MTPNGSETTTGDLLDVVNPIHAEGIWSLSEELVGERFPLH